MANPAAARPPRRRRRARPALNGLYWGDNVGLRRRARRTTWSPSIAAVAGRGRATTAPPSSRSTRDPSEVGLRSPDSRCRRSGGSSARSAAAAARRDRPPCVGKPRQLLLFDSLEHMSRRWTRETAGAFFARGLSAPARPRRDRLLGADRRPPHAGAASPDRGNHPVRARRRRRAPSDCQGRGPPAGGRRQRLPLSARGRAARARGRAGSGPARSGTARTSRRPSPEPGRARAHGRRFGERDLAGRARPRGLSLETLLDLAGKLNITLDDLLRGEVAPGYRLARRDDPRLAESGSARAAARRSPRRPAGVSRPALAGLLSGARVHPQGRRARHRGDGTRPGPARLGESRATAGRGADRRPQRRRRLAQPRRPRGGRLLDPPRRARG